MEFIQIVDKPEITPGLLGTLFTTTLIALEVAGDPEIHEATFETITTVIVALLDKLDVVYVELVAPLIFVPFNRH